MKVLCILSAPAVAARPFAERLLQRHPGATFIFYLRQSDRRALEDLLAGHEIRNDKPVDGRKQFVQRLQEDRFDAAHALALGHWSYWPAKTLLWLCRAQTKRWHCERGEFGHSLWRPDLLLGHAFWRLVVARGPGPALALGAAVYRASLGAVIGATWTIGEFLLRRSRLL